MNCPNCGSEATEVKDSRPNQEENAIRRRRLCTSCDLRFTTFECVREDPPALNPRDQAKWRRAAEIRRLFHELGIDDARLVLSMARRLAGQPAWAEDGEDDTQRAAA